ncbi:MAG: hypothetical protein N3B17_08850 [Chlorobi bacterium]|nr:hypothetical protein [Chlorobiota bacterium]
MEQLIEQIAAVCRTVEAIESQVGAPAAAESTVIEHLAELRSIIEQLQVRSYSTYHACAAIGEIARAGLERDYPGNPYLASIHALAAKEDEHGAITSDLFATCEQILAELTCMPDTTTGIAEALRCARMWLQLSLVRANNCSTEESHLAQVE